MMTLSEPMIVTVEFLARVRKLSLTTINPAEIPDQSSTAWPCTK